MLNNEYIQMQIKMEVYDSLGVDSAFAFDDLYSTRRLFQIDLFRN